MDKVRERPILFNGEMVRAILDGRKTQTRRVVKPQPEHRQVYDWRGKRLHDSEYRVWCYRQHVGADNWDDITRQIGHACPYGQPGDRLWVREAWNAGHTYGGEYPCVFYRSDNTAWIGTPENPVRDVSVGKFGITDGRPAGTAPSGAKWKASIHMPRWASRITLEITDVRVERVQDITHEDAIAEGVTPPDARVTYEEAILAGWGPQRIFSRLWQQINGPRGFGWDANPWCWVVSFRRIEA